MLRYQQRDAIIDLAPPWLKGHATNGERLLYVIGLCYDALLEKLTEANFARMPGYGPPSALPLQASDRLLEQGPKEPNSNLVLRIRNAYAAWAKAGSRQSMLGQLHAYLTGLQSAVDLPEMRMVSVQGTQASAPANWTTLNGLPSSVPSRQPVFPSNWNWDNTYKPWRSWLIFYMRANATGQSGSVASVSSVGGSGIAGVTTGFATLSPLPGLTADNVGDYVTLSGGSAGNTGTFQIVSVLSAVQCIIANPSATAGDTMTWSIARYPLWKPAPAVGSEFCEVGLGTIGITCDPQMWVSIRKIARRWKSAGNWIQYFIVSFGGGTGGAGTEFSPYSSTANGNPSGNWATSGYVVNGVVIPRRSQDHRTVFVDGTGESVQCFAKNVG